MHTPGPWHWTTHPDGTMITNDSGASLALWPSQGGSVEQCANGRLMAAAPDLLAALQKLIGAIDRLPGNNPLDGLADEARAAIARATGKD